MRSGLWPSAICHLLPIITYGYETTTSTLALQRQVALTGSISITPHREMPHRSFHCSSFDIYRVILGSLTLLDTGDSTCARRVLLRAIITGNSHDFIRQLHTSINSQNVMCHTTGYLSRPIWSALSWLRGALVSDTTP